MAQDIRKLFDSERQSKELQVIKESMPEGHESRFLKKLDEELPVRSKKSPFTFLNIAASIVLLLGFSFGAYQFIGSEQVAEIPVETVATKSLGDISPH